jgi:phage terminase small subunit
LSVLSPKQVRFIEEYLVDLNGKQAAIRAGYSAKTAETQASRLLRNAKVRAEFERRQAKLAEKLEITQERIIGELAKLGFANMLDYMRRGPDGDPYLDFSALSRDQAAALTEVTVEDFKDGRGEDARDVRRVKFKLADKRAALVDLGRHLGIFKDRVEHSGPDGKPIQTEDVSARDILSGRITGLAARQGSPESDSKPH